jgi:uncharacterized membrane protein YphA (DoxX/SURF4 family)
MRIYEIMSLEGFQHVFAIVVGFCIFVVALFALHKDWTSPGLDNQVFRLMLGLLALGGVLAALTGLQIIGKA